MIVTKRAPDQLFRTVLVIGGVAVLWLTVFNLNMWLFSHAAFSERAHWIFLPAAFRIMAVLVLGARGAAGLILGAYLTLPHTTSEDLGYEMLLSISSGVAPLAAVVFCRRLFTIHRDLNGLNGWHVIALSVSCAIANSLFLNMLMWVMDKQPLDAEAMLAIFIGDIFGAAIVLGIIATALSPALRLLARARTKV